jgi:hypothetical protein
MAVCVVVGSGGGVAVWAETGVAEKMAKKAALQNRSLLCILELYLVPDLEINQSIRVDFQDVSRWLAGCIERMPGVCQDAVHNDILGINPNDGQIHKNK